MQNVNQNIDSQEDSRVKSLPDLLSENNNLRKRLAEMEIQGVFASKSVLRAARDNIAANNKDFKAYLENIYKQRQANDNSFTYDKNNITTAAFDTISSHIEDTLKEASNSSIFERSDKLKIMEYIKLAIKNSDATDEEIDKYYDKESEAISINLAIKNKTKFVNLVKELQNLSGDTITLESYRIDLDTITNGANYTKAVLYIKYQGNDEIPINITVNNTISSKYSTIEYSVGI